MRGFTLIELLIGLLILAIFVALGVPAVATIRGNVETAIASHRLVALLGTARAAAMASGEDAVVCPLKLREGRAVCGQSYSEGWLLFVDRERDGAFRDATDELLRIDAGRSDNVLQVRTRSGATTIGKLTYRSNGTVRQPRTFRLCRSGATRQYAVVTNRSGRVRTTQEAYLCA